MSNHVARIVSSSIGGMLLLAVGGTLDAAEPGNVTVASQTADSVTLASGADRVLVRVLKPNLLRVDYRPNNQASANTLILDPNLDSKTWSPGTVNISDGASEVVLTTSKMVVRITKSPCRVNIYQTDGTTRIFGEPSSGGMSDSRVKVEFDNGLNWYGIQSAPSQRGREMDFKDVGSYAAKTMVTKLTRHDVSPAVDLNARWHGSESGPYAWTTGAASKPGFGLLWDNDGGSVAFTATTLEMNKTNERAASAVSSTKLNTLWFAMVGTPAEITQSMIDLSGRPQMFPKYALGFGNTEWGINEQELRSHVNAYRSRGIPLDHYILDFDWKQWDLNSYGNFEWNTALTKDDAAKNYPGFPSAAGTTLKTELDAAGVKLMGITKPRLHVDTEHGAVITAGSQDGATWRNATSVGWWLPSGSPSAFHTDYWGSQRGRSDKVGNLNFFIPAARAWYGKNTIDRAFDKGMVGYWHDEGDEGPDSGDIPSASNFYNTLYQEGVYSYQRANRPGTRVWSMNRHSYLGSQRYGYGVWSGDIETDWRILKVEAPRMLQTINAGMARTGSDASGTAGNTNSVGSSSTDGVNKHVPTGELYARWLQFSAFQPTFRIHGIYLINRQPWWHGSEAETATTDVIRLRSKLMPYIYAHDRVYSETGLPLVQPLIWDHPKDANVANRGDEWMFGRHLLAAPILEPRATVTSPDGSQSIGGTTTKSIYLPAGTWYDWFRGTAHGGGASFDYPIQTTTLRDLPLFIRKGAIIPNLPAPLQHVAEKAVTMVRLDMFPDTSATTFPYYDDDGVSYQYEGGTYFKQDVSLQQSGSTVTVTFAAKQGGYTPALQHYLVAINKFAASSVSGFTSYASQAELEAASGEGWAIGSGVHGTITYIKVAAGSARTVTATGSAPAFAIATTVLPTAIRNAPYDVQLGADGLGASATWGVNPALPAGLTLDPRTGRITGTPTVAGSASYTFSVASGSTASKALTLTVSTAPFRAHEAFAFTAGGLDFNGRGGENGFAGPWERLEGNNGQGQLPVYAAAYVPGLSATGLAATGGAIQLSTVEQVPGNVNSRKRPEYARTLLTGFSDGGANGANAWMGFIGKGTTPGDGWLGVGLFNGNSEKLFLGQRSGKSNWGLEIGGGGGSQDTSVALTSSAFVVTNIRVVNGTRTVRVWFNPTPGATAPSDASATITLNTGTDLSFDTLRLRGDSWTSRFAVDELRVGGTFAEVCGLTSTDPELDVSRGAQAVNDAGTDAVTGTVAGTSQGLSYVLTNSGGAAITIPGSVAVGSQTNCVATVTTQPGGSIASGQTSGLNVSVTPSAAGAWSFTLSIANNDGDENPYNWTVSGTAAAAAAPELDIARTGVAVADGGTDAVTGSSAATAQTLTYVLSNTGTGPLSITGAVAVGGLTNCQASVTTQPASTIAGGASSDLVVSVTPTAAGNWSFTLSAGNNDGNENPYDWTVSGTASAQPAPELDITRGGGAVADAGTDAITDSVAGTARAIAYVLTNSGTGALTLSGAPSITALVNCTASVTTAPASSIAGGATSPMTVSVTPTAAGQWSFAIAIASDDANENPYDWTVSGTAASSPSGLLVHEPFAYDAGALAAKNGGTGWTSAWDNGANAVAAPGLTMPGLAVSGNRADLNNGSERVNFRALPNRLPNGTWWVSFIAQSSTPGTGGGGLAFFDGAAEQLYVGQIFGRATWGMLGHGSQVNTTVGSGDAALIVLKLVLRDGADDATIWINPTPAAEPDPTAGQTITGFGELNPDRVRIGSGSLSMKLDEIRLGSAYTTVVVPSTAAPELDVTRGGSGVADGGSDTAFDLAAGATRSFSYTLGNPGDASLSITGAVTASTLVNCEVALTQPASAIAAGANTSLVVSVRPLAVGAWSVKLAVPSTDADENPYDWTLSGTAIASAAPELDVSRSGNAVADGGNDPVAASAANAAQALTYVLSNSGGAALAVTVPVTVPSVSNCTVSFASQPSATIAAGSSSNLVVTVTPISAGPWSFQLSAGNDDSDENPYNWTVSGTAGSAPAAELDVARGTIAIADGGSDAQPATTTGAARSLSYALINSGTAALSVSTPVAVSALTNCTATVTTQPGTSIAAGATGSLVVAVTPTADGPWSFVLAVTSSDTNESPYEWTVSGTAASAPVGGGPGGPGGGQGSPGGKRGCGLGSGFTVLLMLGLGIVLVPGAGRRGK